MHTKKEITNIQADSTHTADSHEIARLETENAEVKNFQARWKDRLDKMHLSNIHPMAPC